MLKSTTLVAAMLAVSAAMLVPASPAWGAVEDRVWDGGGDGSSWSDALNWDPDNVPDTIGINGERAVIGDSPGVRNINTPNAATSTARLFMEQTSAAGVNRLTLGNNLTINDHTQTLFSNSGPASSLVVDLNGHTFTSTAIVSGGAALTITSSAPGGKWISGGYIINPASVVGPNVSLDVSAGQVRMFADMDQSSIFRFVNGSTVVQNSGIISNLQVGLPAGPNARAHFANSVTPNFTGDVVIHSANPTTYQNLRFHSNANFTMSVAGDFIDDAPANALNYASDGNGTANGTNPGTIAFYGNPVTARTVSIARQTLVNHFRVGDNGSDTGGLAGNVASSGNIMLGQDLVTTGSFLIRGGSRVDVVDHILSVGNFDGNSNAMLAYTFGPGGDGLIDVDGLLTLTSNLSIDVTALGAPLENGRTLFTFGSYSGPTDLSSWTLTGDLDENWSAQLLGNSIVLAVPEPASAAVLGVIMLGAFTGRSRCRRHQ